MDVSLFEIDAVMIHDVPRGGHDANEMTLTDAPIALDDQLRGYFQTKITKSLQSRGVEVVVDLNQPSVVRDAVAAAVLTPTALAGQSRLIAEQLHSVQNGGNPPGLLTVMAGAIEGRAAIAILKLEREQGIRFKVNRVRGRATVDLQFLRDLTLTNKTKVFKTSLFFVDNPQDPATMHGRVSDDQRGFQDGRGVADFFLGTFLGCQLRHNPARITLEFVQAAEGFFNDAVRNPETQGRYQVALLATMQDQRLDVTPRVFANTHLDTADRSGFIDRVREAGVEPAAAFEKDLSLVRVEGFKMTFEHGMVLVGRPEDLSDRLTVRDPDTDRPGVDVNDAIKQLNGR